MTHALQPSQPFNPLTMRMVITVKPRFTDTRLIWTPRCLLPRPVSFDETVRAKEGGKETMGFACRLYPSHGPLRFITSHSRFALASAKRKTKRLRRRLDTSLLRAVYFVPWKRKPLHFLLIQPALKYGRTTDTYFLPNQQIFVESRSPYKMICRRPFQTYFYIKRFIQRTVLIK